MAMLISMMAHKDQLLREKDNEIMSLKEENQLLKSQIANYERDQVKQGKPNLQGQNQKRDMASKVNNNMSMLGNMVDNQSVDLLFNDSTNEFQAHRLEYPRTQSNYSSDTDQMRCREGGSSSDVFDTSSLSKLGRKSNNRFS